MSNTPEGIGEQGQEQAHLEQLELRLRRIEGYMAEVRQAAWVVSVLAVAAAVALGLAWFF